MSPTSDFGILIDTHNVVNYILKFRCQDVAQKGISGGPAYSFDTNSVIGIQTKASDYNIGATRDNVLVMPISRILIGLKYYVPEIVNKILAEHTESVLSDPYFRAILTYHDRDSKVKNMFKIEDALQGKSKPFNTLLSVDEGKPISFDKAISELEENNEQSMVIFGGGGAGKTFMFLRETAKMKNTPYDSKDFRYFAFVPLNALDFKTEFPIENYFDEKIFLSKNLQWKEFFIRYNSNNLLILFDGFNELPIEKRGIVAEEINNLPNKINCLFLHDMKIHWQIISIMIEQRSYVNWIHKKSLSILHLGYIRVIFL